MRNTVHGAGGFFDQRNQKINIRSGSNNIDLGGEKFKQ